MEEELSWNSFFHLESEPCVLGDDLHVNCSQNPHCLLGLGERTEGVWDIEKFVQKSLLWQPHLEKRTIPFVGLKV